MGDMLCKCVTVVLLLGCSWSNALDAREICPIQDAGINILVDGSNVAHATPSTALPELPMPTKSAAYGPISTCGFDGTVVFGGPLSLTSGDSFFSYSSMIKEVERLSAA